MIISHKYNFIFIKLGKTAGSSLELALSKFCGKDDIITPIGSDAYQKRKELGFRLPQNYYIADYSILDYGIIKFIRALYDNSKYNVGQILRSSPIPNKLFSFMKDDQNSFQLRNPKKVKLYDHMPGYEIKKFVDDDTWDTYFKFTIVRNPWDQFISKCYDINRTPDQRDKKPFDQYCKEESLHFFNKNWNRYTENDELMVDYCICFENLKNDLGYVSRKLDLPENLYDVFKGIKVNSKYRKNKKDYSLYDKDTEESIRRNAAKII